MFKKQNLIIKYQENISTIIRWNLRLWLEVKFGNIYDSRVDFTPN